MNENDAELAALRQELEETRAQLVKALDAFHEAFLMVRNLRGEIREWGLDKQGFCQGHVYEHMFKVLKDLDDELPRTYRGELR